MKKVYLITCLLLLISILGFSQKTHKDLPSFKAIDAFGPFDIELIKSDKEYAEIDLNGIDQEEVVIEVQKDILKLKIKNRHYFSEWKENSYRKSEYIRVKIYYSDIDVIEAEAGTLITSQQPLKSKYLHIECSMGAEITLDILAKEMEVVTSMGGVLELSGRTDELDVKATMGGELKAGQLESKSVFVKASMGADVMVNVMEELDASAGFGASIDYIGGPNVRHTSSNMGGEVNRKGN